jgi:hypothetical protein
LLLIFKNKGTCAKRLTVIYKRPQKPGSDIEALGQVLKHDLFNLDGLAGLMAVRHNLQAWLTQQPQGDRVTIVAVKPAKQGCRIRLGVTHSTQLQQWQPQMQALQAQLNAMAHITNWPVLEIRLQVI